MSEAALGEKKSATRSRRSRIWLALAVWAVLFGIAAAWEWSPLADEINMRRVSAWAFGLRANPNRVIIILAAYLIGSLLLVPITVLIVATGLVFGPVMGSVYSLAGCFLGAGVTYAIGYFLGRDLVRQVTGTKWERVERNIGRAGILGVATLRLIPVAPFTIVNVVSGAFQVPVRDYLVGSLLGFTPGILAINVFAHQVASAIRDPGVGSFALLAALVVISAWVLFWLRRKLRRER
jgi:phospholipase D1/2